MDLHLTRQPDGTVTRHEVLGAADLADRMGRAHAAGAAWDRWSLYWDMVEHGGQFDWSVVDDMVRRDIASGLGPLAILQGTPQEYATGGQVGLALPPVGGGPGARLADRQAWRARQALAPDGRAGLAGLASPQASAPKNLDRPIFLAANGMATDDPAHAATVNPENPWARFVAAAVERYRPGGVLASAERWPAGVGIGDWEVGNEPNLPFFWSGTEAEFARYLEVAYLTVHWLDPTANVAHGGIADGDGAAGWYGRFLDAIKARAAASPLPAAHGYYFDKAAWHWYVYPTLLQTGPDQARRLLAERGLPAKPIWVTEMGVPIWSEYPGPCWDRASPWRATVPEQAGYLWQSFAEGLASSVERMYVFQLYDDCGNGPTSYDAFGLVRNHAANQCWSVRSDACWRYDPALAGQPRAGYEAYRLAARELAGVQPLWHPAREANWQRVLFFRPPSERVMVVWNYSRNDQTVDVFSTGPQATIYSLDADGTVQTRQATPAAGIHSLALPGATNRNNPGNGSPVMAGRPLIVVERDAFGPFRAQVQALPPESPPRFDLTVSAADGGTGVQSYRVFMATVTPTAVSDWQPLTGEQAWTAPPIAGDVKVAFEGMPNVAYYFAAQARDRAGNLSALPVVPQAMTRVVLNPSTPTPTVIAPTPTRVVPTTTRTPTRSPTPSRTSGAPSTPTTTPTAALTATPSVTPPPLVLVARIFVPFVWK